MIECENKIREELLECGRIYLDYNCCNVQDILAVPRCYRCQGYGHLMKRCKKTGDQVWSNCGEEGHNFKDCPNDKEDPKCVQCKTTKKDAEHRVGTMECPIYVRAVERVTNSTYYNGK